MDPEKIKELLEELQKASALLREKAADAADEKKRYGDFTGETKAALDAINGRINEIEAELKRVPAGTDDADAAAKAAAAERKSAFMHFVKEGIAALSGDERKSLRDVPAEYKKLVEDSTGQILVPEDLDTQILHKVGKLSIMRPLVAVRPTNRDRIRVRSLTELTVGWGKLETQAAGELATRESTMTPSDAYHYVEDLYGLTKIGEDELDDTDVNLESEITTSFARAVSEAIDVAILTGAGHASEEPEGIMVSTNADLVANDMTSAVAATVDEVDLITLSHKVKPQYRARGRYVVSDGISLALRLAVDSNGQFLWQPAMTEGEPSRFNGYPIVVSADMAAVAASSKSAVFGDFQAGYRLLERRGTTIQRLNELYAEDGLVGFKLRRRVGGGVLRGEALARLITHA